MHGLEIARVWCTLIACVWCRHFLALRAGYVGNRLRGAAVHACARIPALRPTCVDRVTSMACSWDNGRPCRAAAAQVTAQGSVSAAESSRARPARAKDKLRGSIRQLL
eukprot:6189943-Pleurochrysis_carterae.AAC.3